MTFPSDEAERYRLLYDDGSYGPWFWKWLGKNPHLLGEFCALALRVRATGRVRFSAAMIIGRMRWDTMMKEGATKELKINENSKSGLARLSMRLHPELDGFFETRLRAKSQARRLLDGKLYSEPIDEEDEDEDSLTSPPW